MRGLNADSGGERGEAKVERHHLHLEAAFLLLVGEGLPHAERRQIGRVGEANFVVLVVDRAGPEANRLDGGCVRPVLALGGEFGLMRVDPGQVVGAVDAGDMIERIGLRDRRPDESAIEDIGAADRRAVGLRRGVRLAAVERLGRVGQVGIARNIVVAGLAAVGVGMHRKVSATRVKKYRTFDAAIDRVHRGSCLRGHAAG